MNEQENSSKGLLKVENLRKYFPLKKGLRVDAVNGVNFTIPVGKTLGLVGESGSGKTTIGRCLVHLLEPTSGRIFLMGKEVNGLSQKEFDLFNKFFGNNRAKKKDRP